MVTRMDMLLLIALIIPQISYFLSSMDRRANDTEQSSMNKGIDCNNDIQISIINDIKAELSTGLNKLPPLIIYKSIERSTKCNKPSSFSSSTSSSEHSTRRIQQRKISLSNLAVSLSTTQLKNTFNLKEKLGDGAFGTVWHGQSKIDSQSYAHKIIPFLQKSCESDEGSDAYLPTLDMSQDTFREVRTMAKMDSHPNVVRYYTAWIEEMHPFLYEKIKDIEIMQTDLPTEDTNTQQHDISSNEDDAGDSSPSLIISNKIPNRALIIQMEMCDDGTLRDWLEARDEVDYIQSLQIFRQMVEGLHHIHKYDVLHRDVKPDNVFLSKKGGIKLGDFGLSIPLFDGTCITNINAKASHANLTSGLGTPTYAAPEQLKTKNKTDYSKPADIYPLGLILFELLNIFSTGMERAMALNQLKNTGKTNDDLKDKYMRMAYMIEAMVSLQPENRPTTDDILEILNMEWLRLQIDSPSHVISPTMTSVSIRSSITGSVFMNLDDTAFPSRFRSSLSDLTDDINHIQKIKALQHEVKIKNLQIEMLQKRICKLEDQV
eukprot:772704_1